MTMPVSTRTGMEIGFVITGAADEAGKYHSVARFYCDGCSQVLDRHIKSGEMNPEMIAKWARRRGWVVISGRPGHVTCPDCVNEQALKKMEDEPMPNLKPVKPIGNGNGASPPAPIITPEVIPPTSQRTLTTEQRVRIRHLLEANFDEELGYYVGGYSDQRIAEELDIPRVLVERAREFAYGPIKVTQAQLEARHKMEDFARRITDLESAGRELARQITQDVVDLRKELDMLRREVTT